MNTTMKLVLATAVSSAFTSSAFAEVPNTFTANTPAKASEVNANFTALDQDISSLGTEVDDLTDEVDSIEARVTSLEDSGVSTDAYSTVDINCNDDADSLKGALEDSRNTTTRTTYNVTGACNSVFIVRNDVKIVGVDSASILAGASQDEPEAVFIDGQSSVRLQDITLGGMLFARNSSSVRFDNVTLPTAVEDGDEYQTNVTIRTAYLRVNSGSVNNLALHLNRNASVDIRSSITGSAPQAIADANSSLVVDSGDVSFTNLEAIGSSFVYVSNLVAENVVVESGSTLEADELTVSNELEAWGNSRISVWGDATITNETYISQTSSFVSDGDVSSGVFECESNSMFQILGNLTVTDTFEWDDSNTSGLSLQRGCHGQYGVDEENGGTFNGSLIKDNYSALVDGQYMEVIPD
ncbi:hypothetical protein OQJ65_07965 [Vibrio sp. Sgm 22]|uniref:hypothetical protein n=1 Tax=unclassified Vibrio TaxID=2614977 RepID=UPI002248CAAF|nr:MULTISPECIES: hypothetical protein [unclassified Vibrio]MCX2757970.1 hypothetical protein [Vibrio sp. 14G-20]MCX2775241.1 hypothetical protein [Vibrio sp. Sgm 22]